MVHTTQRAHNALTHGSAPCDLSTELIFSLTSFCLRAVYALLSGLYSIACCRRHSHKDGGQRRGEVWRGNEQGVLSPRCC